MCIYVIKFVRLKHETLLEWLNITQLTTKNFVTVFLFVFSVYRIHSTCRVHSVTCQRQIAIRTCKYCDKYFLSDYRLMYNYLKYSLREDFINLLSLSELIGLTLGTRWGKWPTN